MTEKREELQFFTGSQLEGGQMLSSFKRFLDKELEKHMKFNRNDVIDHREYNFRHVVRGIAVVISNENFQPVSGCKMEPRTYANEELRKMNKMFSGLGFIVMLFKDLTAQQMYEVIQTVSSQEMDFFLERSDAFACVIASHGNEVQEENPTNPNVAIYHHVVYGTDRAIRTHLLMDLLHGKRCRKLQGKPKLFFIQACRSRFRTDPLRFDRGVKIPTPNKHLRQGHDKKESVLDHSEDIEFSNTISPSKADGFMDKVESCNDYPASDSPEDQNLQSADDKVSSSENETDSEKNPNQRDYGENTHQNDGSKGMGLTAELHKRKHLDDDDDDYDDYDIPCLNVEFVKEKTEDTLEGLSVFKWVEKHVFKMKPVRPKDQLESMTTVKTPCHNDFLVMYSTSQGKAGYGREGQGGWLLHAMHGIMEKHIKFICEHQDNCLDFLIVMTQVMNCICLKFETDTGNPSTSGIKTAPTLQHKLSNDLIFRKKYIS